MEDRNRVAGLKEVWIAKTLMLSNERFSARRKLERAMELCSELDDLETMLKVCDILILGDNTDVLTKLGLNLNSVSNLFLPSGTDSAYKKLLESLESIKDEFPGTEKALQILSDVFQRDSDGEINQEAFEGSESEAEGSSPENNLIDVEGSVEDKLQFSGESQPEEEQTPVSDRVYPKKGEVWAIYKNREARDDGGCEYYAVEIMAGFCRENGVTVCKLVTMGDCETMFQRSRIEGSEMVRQISVPEMHCFSHRIPASRLNGGRAYGIPEGAWHLEPHAIPMCRDN